MHMTFISPVAPRAEAL